MDNVATVPMLNGVSKHEARARALELMDTVGLDRALGERYPRQLSGGQQQRVGVARALASDPNILLMDEPFGAVDPIVRADLQIELNRLQRELGKTIVFVTHDIDEAFTLADQVVILKTGGEIAQAGTRRRSWPIRRTISWPLSSARTRASAICSCSSAKTTADSPWWSTAKVDRSASSKVGMPSGGPTERGGRRLVRWTLNNLDLIAELTLNHVRLSVIPILVSFLLSIPLGWLANRNKVLRAIVITGGSLLYTIPSLPLFVILPLVIPTRVLDETNLIVALSIYGVALMARSASDALSSLPDSTSMPPARSASPPPPGSSALSCHWPDQCC